MNERFKDEGVLSTADFVAGGERRQGGEPEHPEMSRAGTAAGMAREETPAALLNETEAQDLRNRWNDIQTGFVDEPRKAVEQADQLVATAMKRLAEMFAEERSKLEKQWDRGDNISTEDLRIALQRYRSFFNRLLSM